MRYKIGEFQNAAISSTIILKRTRVPDRDFERSCDREVAERQDRLGRTLCDEERAAVRAEVVVVPFPPLLALPLPNSTEVEMPGYE